MSALSPKSLMLLSVMLMVALGLQAGAIKTLISLQQPDTLDGARLAAALEAHPKELTSTKEPLPVPPREPLLEPTHPTSPPPTQHSEPSPPEIATADAPPKAPSVEAPPALPPAPAPITTLVAEPPPAHNPMTSNIPPPIQLDPEPAPLEAPPIPPIPPTSSEPSPLASAAATAEEAPTPSTGTLLEPDWLKGRDPKRYTVQLYSGKDMNKLREIASASSSVAPSAYFTTASRSGPWHSLVIGDFADFNSAQAAATKLAAQPSASKPWIRRFSEIQAKMR